MQVFPQVAYYCIIFDSILARKGIELTLQFQNHFKDFNDNVRKSL